MPMRSLAFTAALAALLLCLGTHRVHAALADELQTVQRLHREGQSAAALERADRYLAAQPKDAQMRFLKSVVLADAGRPAEAERELRALAEDFPELPEPHNNLAALYAAAGDFDKARASLAETLRLDPSSAAAHENLGDVYARLAEQSYQRALRLEPASRSLPPKLRIVRDLATRTATPETRTR
jgi:Flp pilus assembly protein TadD